MKEFLICKYLSTNKALIKKMLKTMKLTAFIIFIGCLQVSAKGYGQITLSVKNAPLEKVFTALREQTGYAFFYDLKEIKNATPVTVKLRNTNLNDALNVCLKGQQLTFTIVSNTVVIKAAGLPALSKPESFITPYTAVPAAPPPVDVNGRVTNENGEPLDGVTITIKGKKISTATNAAGEFTLTNVDENATLVFTSVNLETAEVKVAGRRLINISLKLKIGKLDEVQIMAYRSTSRRLNTSNISIVTAKEIEATPSANPVLSLEGRTPGIEIIQQSGFAGAGTRIAVQSANIRGFIGAGRDPLFIVDGVPFSIQNLDGSILNIPNNVSILGNGANNSSDRVGTRGGSPLNFINPQDIESISLLKDAAATSIYGSRGANGVVLITTKKGKAGATKIDFNIKNGFGKVAKRLDLLTTPDYLAMRRQAYISDGLSVPGINTANNFNYDSVNNTNYDLTFWDPNRNTDWQSELLGGRAKYFDAQLAVSGGNQYTQFRASGNLHRETTIYPGNDLRDIKGTIGLNLNHNTPNNRFNLQFNVNYQADDNRLPNYDLTSKALTLAPNAPALYTADGKLNWEPDSLGNSTWQNPLQVAASRNYFQKSTSLISNIALKYKVIPGLFLKTSIGYNDTRLDAFSASPGGQYGPEVTITPNDRSASFGAGRNTSLQIEPQITYNKFTKYGTFDVVLGSSFLKNVFTNQSFFATGFSSDFLLKNPGAAQKTTQNTSFNSLYSYAAVFGLLNYNLKNKYVAEVSARRDGSSRFGPNSRFSVFSGAAAAWIFTAENFLKRLSPILSFGKIKASIGTTGNDQIPNFGFLDLYSAPAVQPTPYQDATTLVPFQLFNPNLQWEQSKKISAALELGFFNDKLIINAAYYNNKTSNQLSTEALPGTAGFTSRVINLNNVVIQNSGIELTVTSANIKTKNFTWSSFLNITIPRSKLLTFNGIENTAFKDRFVVGKSLGITKAYRFAGINDTTGRYQFFNAAGTIIPASGTPNSTTDRVEIGNTDTRYYGGLENTFTYKNFSLGFLIQFKKTPFLNPYPGGLENPGNFYSDVFSADGLRGNVTTANLNYWKAPGDKTRFQRLTTQRGGRISFLGASVGTNLGAAAGNFSPLNSDFAYNFNGYYIRLKNVSLSYLLPAKWVGKAHIQSVRLYGQGQNLFTKTNFEGLDPETQNYFNLPPLRTIVFGAQVSF
jgi:TonB-dependent starch-binding outer membrane protein SusC